MITMQNRKRYSVLFLICSLIVLNGMQGNAEGKGGPVAVVSAARNGGFIRIVFETAEDYVQKASVIMKGNSIEVYFPSPVIFRVPQGGKKGRMSAGEAFEMLRGVSLVPRREGCTIMAQNLRDTFTVPVRNEELPIPLITHVNSPALLIEIPNPGQFSYDREVEESMLKAMLGALCPGRRQ